jgi:Flp pilus assembly protein TadB
VVVVIVVPIVLGRLANHGPDTGTCCSTNQSALQAAAKDRTQRRAAGPANQRALARTNAALILVMVVIVMIAMVVLVVVVTAPTAATHPVVVGAVVVMVLGVRRSEAGNE